MNGALVIVDPAGLDAYIACYGGMHYHKMIDACQQINLNQLAGNALVEVWDWGCGPGIATYALLDEMQSCGVSTENIARLVLIDSSGCAVRRAFELLSRDWPNFFTHASVHRIEADLSQLRDTVLPTNRLTIKLHLLSNVLDLEGLDVQRFGSFVQQTFSGTNIFLMVSPANARADSQITSFCRTVMYGKRVEYNRIRQAALLRRVYQVWPENQRGFVALYPITRYERLLGVTL